MEKYEIEKKIFIAFLKQKKILKQYISYTEHIKLLFTKKPQSWISGMIFFGKTSEGTEFWNDIACEWKKILFNYDKSLYGAQKRLITDELKWWRNLDAYGYYGNFDLYEYYNLNDYYNRNRFYDTLFNDETNGLTLNYYER